MQALTLHGLNPISNQVTEGSGLYQRIPKRYDEFVDFGHSFK